MKIGDLFTKPINRPINGVIKADQKPVLDQMCRVMQASDIKLFRIMGHTDAAGSDASGAIWNLPIRRRDLDSNVIALPPGGTIEAHNGPDLDVLIHVVAGSGRVGTEIGEVELTPGALLWLPRRSRRSFTAGPDGLRYLTVHQRRQSLVLQTRAPADR